MRVLLANQNWGNILNAITNKLNRRLFHCEWAQRYSSSLEVGHLFKTDGHGRSRRCPSYRELQYSKLLVSQLFPVYPSKQ